MHFISLSLSPLLWLVVIPTISWFYGLCYSYRDIQQSLPHPVWHLHQLIEPSTASAQSSRAPGSERKLGPPEEWLWCPCPLQVTGPQICHPVLPCHVWLNVQLVQPSWNRFVVFRPHLPNDTCCEKVFGDWLQGHKDCTQSHVDGLFTYSITSGHIQHMNQYCIGRLAAIRSNCIWLCKI